jgi:hypothetical protein
MKNSGAFFRVMSKLSDIDDKDERERQIQAMRRIHVKSIELAKAKEAKPRWRRKLKKFFRNLIFSPYGER